MQIITTNFPKKIIERIDKFCNDDGLYPSRSEFFRVAIHRFIVEELNKVMKDQEKLKLSKSKEEIERIMSPKLKKEDNISMVSIPEYKGGELSYKNYKIISK